MKMKNTIRFLALLLLPLLIMTQCKKPIPKPTMQFMFYVRNNGQYYTYPLGKLQCQLYSSDTLKIVSQCKQADRYIYDFGDGTVINSTDTVVYHTYHGLQGYQGFESTIRITAFNGSVADSVGYSNYIFKPLRNFPIFPGSNCWGDDKYSFNCNPDSTVLYSNINVILSDSIMARCILIDERHFIIPFQSRTSTQGLAYTISGSGRVITDPTRTFANTLIISDTLSYGIGVHQFDYMCHDTVSN